MDLAKLSSFEESTISKSNLSDKVIGQLVQLAKWDGLYAYLLKSGYVPTNTGLERQSKRALRDLDTYVVSLLLCDKYCDGAKPFTLRSLAMAIDGEDFNSIKAREKKLKLLFERLEMFEIINFYKDIHQGNRECWRIEARSKLINFIKTEL